MQVAASAPTLQSEVLGLDLRVHRGALRFRDTVTGGDLLSHEEESTARLAAESWAKREAAARRREATAREAAEVRAEKEAVAREVAEAQLAELRARVQDVRGGRSSPEG